MFELLPEKPTRLAKLSFAGVEVLEGGCGGTLLAKGEVRPEVGGVGLTCRVEKAE